jgi:hypothetical protein
MTILARSRPIYISSIIVGCVPLFPRYWPYRTARQAGMAKGLRDLMVY